MTNWIDFYVGDDKKRKKYALVFLRLEFAPEFINFIAISTIFAVDYVTILILKGLKILWDLVFCNNSIQILVSMKNGLDPQSQGSHQHFSLAVIVIDD
jgi:hypothetical protein